MTLLVKQGLLDLMSDAALNVRARKACSLTFTFSAVASPINENSGRAELSHGRGTFLNAWKKDYGGFPKGVDN